MVAAYNLTSKYTPNKKRQVYTAKTQLLTFSPPKNLVMADPRLKTIKIKTGVVKRITKEKIVYERELDEQKEKIEKWKLAGKDEYDLKKQEEVLGECLMMIPDCKRRLARAFEDLQKIVDNELDLKETEEYTAAVTALDQAKEHLPTPEL